MPESHWQPSFPLAMDSMQYEIIPEESSFELEKGSAMELSIDILAALPEISIPSLLLDPLPLQCLAANALPDRVKREIESVTASVIEPNSSLSSSETIELESEGLCSVRTGVDMTEKRLVLTRDAVQAELVNDLGIGVRITGGVKCRSCGILHAVVMEVNRHSTHSSEICEGMCVVEWCGKSLLGATFEQTTKILGSTQGESVEIVVKECGGKRQSKESNRACNMFLDFTALSANVRTLTDGPSSRDVQTDLLAVPERGTVSLDRAEPMSGSKISRSLSSNLVSETKPSSLTKLSPRPFSANLSVHSEAMETEEIPSNELSFPLPTFDSPKTSAIFPEDSFDDFFASLPSGMIRLSLTYDKEQERLRIILSQVKAQSSREVNDSSNVFINAHLIPDIRSQGAKFTKAAVTPSDIQNAPIYNIKKSEIDSAALRVVLWEAPKKGSATFRGEVLLRLSDNEIVNLDGDPTWYTVCPEDPNLPPLSAPITHRGKQRERVEQLFNRFKQTFNHGPTQALSYFKQHTSKAVVSGSDNISLDSNGSIDLSSSRSGSTSSLPSMRRQGSMPNKKQQHRDRFGSMSRKTLLRLGKEATQSKASVDNSATTIHEESERLSKIISILHVLQQEDSCLDFPIDCDPAEETKRAKLQSILTVLKEKKTPKSSPVDSPDLHPANGDSDFSTLDRRNRKRTPKPAASTSNPSPKHQKAENGPGTFPAMGTIPVISTSEELDGTQSSNSESDTLPVRDSATSKREDETHSAESSPAIDSNRDSFSTIQDLRGSLNAGNTDHNVTVYSFLSESDASRHSQNTQEEEDLSAPTSSRQQQHYQLVDEQQTDDELDDKSDEITANPSSRVESSLLHASKKKVTRTDSDCSCYSVNVNIGKQEERAPKTDRLSPSTLNPPVLRLTDESDWASTRRKSRSVGDILDLDSDDEVPFEQLPDLTEMKGCHTLAEENEHLPDVEFETRPQHSLKLPPTQPPAAPSSGKGRGGSLFSKMPWAKRKGPHKQTLKSKWVSMDNLIDAVSGSRSKKERRQQRPTSGGSWGKTSGSMSLELCYDLQHPLLTMSLVDVDFLPTKGLTSDVTVKAQLFHNSTKVCLLKRKAIISLKKSTAPAPLASFQFEADITNMALQVSLLNGSRLFSKKTSGQVWIDLNALQLKQNQKCSQWFQLSKTSTA